MLVLVIITWVYLYLFYGWGRLFSFWLGVRTQSTSLQVLAGMALCSLLLTLCAFFTPLTWLHEIAVISVPLLVFSFGKNNRPALTEELNSGAHWGAIIVAAFLGSFVPFLLDHYSYYIPSILWLKELGLTRGLANADMMLAQMSGWHLLQAGFSTIIDPFYRINVALLACFFWYGIEKKKYYLFLFIPLFYFFLQSPSPDLPIYVLTLVLADAVLREKNTEDFPLLLVLAAWTLLLKPTGFWLLLLFIPWMITHQQAKKAIIFSVIVFLAMVLKNCLTFGFPVFPLPWLDVGLPWQPHPKMLESSTQMGLVKTFEEVYTVEELHRMTWYEKIFAWWRLPGGAGIINIFYTVVLFFILIGFLRKKKLIYTYFSGVFLFKTLLIIYISGQHRFLVDSLFIVGVLFLPKKQDWKTYTLPTALGTLAICLLFLFPILLRTHFPSFKSARMMQPFTKAQWWLPQQKPQPPCRTYTVGNFTFSMATGTYYNYLTPSPAISLYYVKMYTELGIFPQWDGATLVPKRINQKELLDLQKIVEREEHLSPTSHE